MWIDLCVRIPGAIEAVERNETALYVIGANRADKICDSLNKLVGILSSNQQLVRRMHMLTLSTETMSTDASKCRLFEVGNK